MLGNRTVPWRATALLLVLTAAAGSGCKTVQQLAALRSVAFAIDGVNEVRLAGVDIMRIRSFDDIGLLDAGRLAAGIATGNLPLRMTMLVGATNPASNPVDARLVRMDWSLFLNDTETVRGIVEQPVSIPSGSTVAIPVGIELNLVSFFDRSARDLVDLVLGLTGQGSTTTDLRLQATPTVDTPLGPIRYPQPISIVRTRVGS